MLEIIDIAVNALGILEHFGEKRGFTMTGCQDRDERLFDIFDWMAEKRY